MRVAAHPSRSVLSPAEFRVNPVRNVTFRKLLRYFYWLETSVRSFRLLCDGWAVLLLIVNDDICFSCSLSSLSFPHVVTTLQYGRRHCADLLWFFVPPQYMQTQCQFLASLVLATRSL